MSKNVTCYCLFESIPLVGHGAAEVSPHQHMGGDKGKEDCSADASSGSRETGMLLLSSALVVVTCGMTCK